MITATLYIENCPDVLDLVESLKALPEELRPIYFAENEGKIFKANLLSNEKRFREFSKKNFYGFFLYTGNGSFYDLSIRSKEPTQITFYVLNNIAPEIVVTLFKSLSRFNPIFGFGCHDSEYKHRNRYYITIENNHIEDWVGRRLENYIPGIYWYTLLSNELLRKHKVNLAELLKEVISIETLQNDSLYLLKFFESPEKWEENAQRLDDICARTNGIFSKRDIEKSIQPGLTYARYSEVVRQWR